MLDTDHKETSHASMGPSLWQGLRPQKETCLAAEISEAACFFIHTNDHVCICVVE